MYIGNNLILAAQYIHNENLISKRKKDVVGGERKSKEVSAFSLDIDGVEMS